MQAGRSCDDGSVEAAGGAPQTTSLAQAEAGFRGDIEGRWRRLLDWFCADPSRHARWLNTLAFLEHTGNRKMVKALSSELLSTDLLQHIAEESRHALTFRRFAEDTRSQNYAFKPDDIWASAATHRYFSELDGAISELVTTRWQHPHAPYYAVTLAIEERATWLYTKYDHHLQRIDSPISLRGILQEEQRHLSEVRTWLETQGIGPGEYRSCRTLESGLFREWTDALELLRSQPAGNGRHLEQAQTTTGKLEVPAAADHT